MSSSATDPFATRPPSPSNDSNRINSIPRSPTSSSKDKETDSSVKDVERIVVPNVSPADFASTIASATAFAATKKAHFTTGSVSGWSTPNGATPFIRSAAASTASLQPHHRTHSITTSPLTRPPSSPGQFGQSSPGLVKRSAARMASHLIPYALTDRTNPPPMSGTPDQPSLIPLSRSVFSRILTAVFSSTSSATSSHPYTPIAKPWLDSPSKSHKIRSTLSRYMVYTLIMVGMGLGILQGFFQMQSVRNRMLVAPSDGPFGPIGAFFRSNEAVVYPKTSGDGFAEGIQAGKYLGSSQSGNGMCLKFDETFSDGSDSIFGKYNPATDKVEGGRWMREVSMNGFGTGEFEMATLSESNSFVKNNQLWIMPTLTEESGISPDSILDGAVYNITGCTYNVTNPTAPGQKFNTEGYLDACSAVSNATTGRIINPIQSARLTTRASGDKGSIRYGMVEVRAKMPKGDWLWPAIWMLPVPANPEVSSDGHYGPWPRSGEIDIVESRGNPIEYTARGSNYVQGSLNWGPTPLLNSFAKSYSWWSDKRRGFDEGFHTYRLEWDERFIRMSIDTRLHTLLDISFSKEDFFTRGDYPDVFVNETNGALQGLTNPWANASDEKSVKSAPFDRPFYLILNVAVGSRTGWFPEGQGSKPWLDGSATAMRDFYAAKNKNKDGTPGWYTTWPGSGGQGNIRDRAMVVDYVKMWEKC